MKKRVTRINEGMVNINGIHIINDGECRYFDFGSLAEHLEKKFFISKGLGEVSNWDDDRKKILASDIVRQMPECDNLNNDEATEVACVLYTLIVKYSGASKLNNIGLNESNKMKKNVIKINENKLRNLIKESVKNVLNEGCTDQSLYNAWDTAIEMMGAENFLNELYNALSEDEIRENLEWIDRNHGLGLFNDDDEDYDDEGIY